jgi:hypothetical protein
MLNAIQQTLIKAAFAYSELQSATGPTPMHWINHFSVAAVLVLAITAKPARSDTYIPKFERFLAGSTYKGKPKMPDFNGIDRQYREYRSRIREGLAEHPTSGCEIRARRRLAFPISCIDRHGHKF